MLARLMNKDIQPCGYKLESSPEEGEQLRLDNKKKTQNTQLNQKYSISFHNSKLRLQ